MWVCVEKRWEAVVLVAFIWVKFSLMLKPAVLHLQGRVPATCVENVTESGREIKGYICQSTVVPSDIRSQSMVSTQPFIIGDTLIGMDLMLYDHRL